MKVVVKGGRPENQPQKKKTQKSCGTRIKVSQRDFGWMVGQRQYAGFFGKPGKNEKQFLETFTTKIT